MRAGSLILLCLLATATWAADKLPQGPGLTAKYPLDANIAKDPAVLFADDFESGDLKKWDDKSGTLTVTTDAPHAGQRCAVAPMEKGKSTGGEAKKWFLPGHDRVFARVYVKFSADYQYPHHFLWLGGSPKNDKWRPFGKAGRKPDGTYFSTGMEAWFAWGKNPPPGELHMYAYHMDMAVDPKMNKYWGNSFYPPGPDAGKAAQDKTRVLPKLNQWQCWEFMLQANTPGKADGRQAMWLDGQLVGDFPNIRWRDTDDARVTVFWLEHYGYDSSDPTRQYHKDKQTVWFDDVVVATDYIGPRVEK